MRRIALAMGPVFALVVAAVPAIPAHSEIPARSAMPASHASHSRTPASSSGHGLDTGTSAIGTTYVSVSWNWIRAASGYRIQVSSSQDFSQVVSTRTARNASHRPTGGRQATTVGHLRDATLYWARVRKVKGHHQGPWSAPAQVATKAHMPDKIATVSDVAGAGPGETTIRWKSSGKYTDFYRIKTALMPFGNAHTPAVGRHGRTFTAPGTARSLTLTAAQTAEAGAGLGTGFHLFFRVMAVRQGPADSQVRKYAYIQFATVAGQAATTTGSPLRVANYNIHLQVRDIPGHPWKDRTPLIAANLASAQPTIAAVEEFVPAMWTNGDGGIGLQAALRNQGLGRYQLTRDTIYSPGVPGDTRILYDPTRVQMVSSCDPGQISCAIRLPDAHTHYTPYALFRDLATGSEFWFVAAHLTPGNNAQTDALRGQQVQAIVDAMARMNTAGLPVIAGGDLNGAQTSAGQDSPHNAFLGAGYYDTSAAAVQVHLNYNTVNAYKSPERPSAYGFGARYDSIFTLGMPGADRFEQVVTGAPFPSDHNLVFTDLRLP